MLSISEIVAKAETMFDLFNAHFYDGELARPAITVSPDGGRGAYGWCSVYEIWQANGAAYREINICAEYINRPSGEVAATMLHEMATVGVCMALLITAVWAVMCIAAESIVKRTDKTAAEESVK